MNILAKLFPFSAHPKEQPIQEQLETAGSKGVKKGEGDGRNVQG